MARDLMSGSGNALSQIRHFPVFHFPVFHFPVFHFPVFHFPVFHFPVFHFPVFHFPVFHFPVRHQRSTSASTKSMLPRIARRSGTIEPRLISGTICIWGKDGARMRTR